MCNSQGKRRRGGTLFLKSLFSDNACFFFLLVIYNSIYEELILCYWYKSHYYQAMILKLILKVRKLGKIGCRR